ncbi:MAG TPA: alpha/beta hydrolase [Kofleriaceae bacterium]|nr:alpha/beta hydrolase [Kofleriaceae bacterium]
MRLTRLAVVCALGACGTSSSPTAPFAVPGGPHPPADFYDLPFPNDLRMKDGKVDMSAYPTPNAILNTYNAAISAELDGFGTNAAIVTRFDDPPDVSTLPQSPADSRADTASVYLVNIEPTSPDYGVKWPLVIRFEPRKGQTIGTNWLSALPYPGFPMDEGQTYALVITNRLHADGGAPYVASSDFEAIRGASAPSDPFLASAQATYAKLWTYLDQPGGDERADVVSAAVFTTQHVTNMIAMMRQKVQAMPAPVPSTLAKTGTSGNYVQYDGVFDGPNFQAGDAPYSTEGGQIELGTDGLPVVSHTEHLRFAFTVPNGTKPAKGWPVVIYAHGTGGNYHSFIGEGVATRLADQGLAVISMDQVLNSVRDPGNNPDFDFFNVQNPQAARNNTLQGAADDFSLLRLAKGIDFDNVTFDPDRIYFFGHSQGGLTGPPFLSAEPEVKGAVLSGAGAVLYLSLLTKTEPVDIASIVASAVRDPNLDENDPILAILQMWIERSDPANYGAQLARRPRDGMAPKPIFQSEGFVDSYAPPPTIEAFAVSIGGNQVLPTKTTIDGLSLRDRPVLTAPVMNNLNGVTVVLLQYDQAGANDGHFVIFDVPAAETQSSQFLGTLSATGTATLVGAQ